MADRIRVVIEGDSVDLRHAAEARGKTVRRTGVVVQPRPAELHGRA
jgi:hypothetical protein